MKRFIFSTFILWRICLYVVGFLSPFIIPIFGNRFPYWQTLLRDTGLPEFLWSWGNFDGVHYLTIASRGYEAQFTQAFFPLFPIFIKLFSTVFHLPFIVSAMVISNVFTLIFLYLFYILLKIEKYSPEIIRWTLIFTLLYPFSFFLGAIYNESFFLSLLLASFILFRKNKWFYAGLCGALATSTRLIGIFLLPAFLWDIWTVYKKEKKFNIGSLWILLIPIGLFCYMIYLQINFRDPLYFIHAQSVFGASRTGGEIILLPQVVWRYIKILITVPPNHYDFWVALWEMGSVFIFSVVFILYGRRIKFSYTIFAVLTLLAPTLTGTFSSMPRYILSAFPFFILHAFIKNNKIKTILTIFYSILLIIFTTFFLRGYWVS